MTTPTEPYRDQRRWWILAACAVVAFAQLCEPHLWMIGFEIPASAFGSAWREYRILANLGTVLFVAFQLVGGVLGDLIGRRQILLVGAIGATFGNVLSLIAPDPATLTVARALTGVMGALALPLTLGIIRLTFSGKERTTALVIYTFVTSLGILAALLGIPFTYWFGWRSTLILPIVIGAIGVALAWRSVPESRASGGFGRVEAITAAAWTLIFLAVIFGLVVARTFGTWRNPLTLASGGAAVVGLLLMAAWVQYVGQGQFFRRMNELLPRYFLWMLLVVSGVLSFGMVGYSLQLYTFFFTVQQGSPILAGLALAPIVLGNLFVLRRASRFVDEQPTYVAVAAGLAAMAVAALLTAFVRPNTPYLLVVPLLVLFGIGFLVASASWSYFFFAALPPDLVGLAAGINRAAGLVGTALSSIILATLIEARGMTDFKLRLGDLGLEPGQQERALAAVDALLRAGLTSDDVAQLPGSLGALGVLAAYRDAYAAGISAAMLMVAAVLFGCAALAWVWLRQVYRTAADRPLSATPVERSALE